MTKIVPMLSKVTKVTKIVPMLSCPFGRAVAVSVYVATCLGCGSSTGLAGNGPGDAGARAADPVPDFRGVQCGSQVCDAPAEVCHRCGRDWEQAFCLPRDEDGWDRCGADPFHWVVAQCDGNEDCEDGEECAGLGAAVGTLMLRCHSFYDVFNVCHFDDECDEGETCAATEFAPYTMCTP